MVLLVTRQRRVVGERSDGKALATPSGVPGFESQSHGKKCDSSTYCVTSSKEAGTGESLGLHRGQPNQTGQLQASDRLCFKQIKHTNS